MSRCWTQLPGKASIPSFLRSRACCVCPVPHSSMPACALSARSRARCSFFTPHSLPPSKQFPATLEGLKSLCEGTRALQAATLQAKTIPWTAFLPLPPDGSRHGDDRARRDTVLSLSIIRSSSLGGSHERQLESLPLLRTGRRNLAISSEPCWVYGASLLSTEDL